MKATWLDASGNKRGQRKSRNYKKGAVRKGGSTSLLDLSATRVNDPSSGRAVENNPQAAPKIKNWEKENIK